MRVKINNNGETFIAISSYDIVLYLWQNSFQKESDILAFMLNYARRAVMVANEDIRATSVKEFVEDLEKYKHIVIMPDSSLN